MPIEEVERLAKRTATRIWDEIAEAGDTEQKRKLAQQSASHPRIRGMIQLARSEDRVLISQPDLDRHEWLLNCWNGTLDLKTGELQPHCRGHLITKLAPVTYDPDAQCPTWKPFLHRIMDGNRGLIRFLQRAVGYALTGDISEQRVIRHYLSPCQA